MVVDPRMFAPFNLGELMERQSNIAYRRHTMDRQTAEDERDAASRRTQADFILSQQGGAQPTPTLGSLMPGAAPTGAPPNAAWEAAVRADPAAALQARQSQTTFSRAQLDQAQEQLDMIGRLAGSVSDQASYSAALQRARGMGLNVDHLPPQYDQRVIEQIRSEAMSAQQQIQAQRDRWVPVGENGLIRIDAQGNPVGEGNPYAPGAAAPQPAPAAPANMSEAELRARARRAIENGADPAQVNRRLEELLRGGAGGQAQTPFADPARYSRTAMAESGGRDFTPSGAPVRSPRGALYSMQVMPDTAASPGFGVSPARNSSPAEYNRVGREYIDAMVREFGSEAAGAAAYNYGPARFRRLIARHPRDWRNHLPRETLDYLRRQGF